MGDPIPKWMLLAIDAAAAAFGEGFLETALSCFFLFLKKNMYLALPGLSCRVWDPVPGAVVKPGPPALEPGVSASGPPGSSTP